MNEKPLIIIGGGSHAAVVAELVMLTGEKILGCTDATIEAGTNVHEDVIVLGTDDILSKHHPCDVDLVMGIGIMPGKDIRSKLIRKLQGQGYVFPNFIHPTAIIGNDVNLFPGVQVMAGAIVQIGASIGAHTIVNTGAIIEHHCEIQGHTHIATGARLCGNVTVGAHNFIGAGSTLIQDISTGDHSLVGAGSVVLNNLPAGSAVGGVPAKSIAHSGKKK